MTFRRMVFYIVILALIGIVGYVLVHKTPVNTVAVPPNKPVQTVISTAQYSCDNGASITANFTSNSVGLDLSDGRHLDLPQTLSADGAQYGQGTTLFVTKGAQAFLQENGATTFNNCLSGSTSASSDNSSKTFTDQGKTFTFTYPSDFTLASGPIGYTQDWKQNADKSLGLVLATVTVPQSYEPNTNFGDAKLTVGTSVDATAIKNCLSLSGNGVKKTTTTINGVKYTVITSSDAAAGNRYDTTSYRVVRNNQCYAVDYTIHYGAIENYDPSMGIKAFDEQKIHDALDAIVQSFTFLPQQQ